MTHKAFKLFIAFAIILSVHKGYSKEAGNGISPKPAAEKGVIQANRSMTQRINIRHETISPANMAGGDSHQLSGTSLIASEGYNTIEKSKTITKNYNVSSNDRLSVDNQYGAVTVNTWNKNEIRVDITIKAFEASDSQAEDLLNGVNINESREGGNIGLKTSIQKSKNTWWGVRQKDGREERRGVQVNYVIHIPAKNPLEITNKYGSTVVPDYEGVLSIISSYGSFNGGSLNNPGNRIRVRYGSASVGSLNGGQVDVAYGSLKLENADKLTADISYSSAKIGRLSGTADLNIKYSGGFKIEQIDRKLQDMNINASFSSVSIGFEPEANFDFDVTVNYAGFKYNSDKVNITSTSPEENTRGFKPTKNYKGRYGKGSDSKIIIKSNYGSVQFL